jgi:hypothetical protein
MKEVKEPKKTFEKEVLDRLEALEYRMNIVWNEVNFHSSIDEELNVKKTFLKGRVDNLELEIKELKKTFKQQEQ